MDEGFRAVGLRFLRVEERGFGDLIRVLFKGKVIVRDD